MVFILDRHIWSQCCCFLSSHPILFKVPAQPYLVFFYDHFLLSFQVAPHWPFSINPFSTAHVAIRTFKTLCLSRSSLPASIWPPDVRCITLSTHFPHHLHMSESMFMPLFFLHSLVSIICCCMLIALAFLGSMLHLSHSCPPSSRFWYKSLCIFFCSYCRIQLASLFL